MSLTSSELEKTTPTPDFESRTPQKTTPTPNFESRTPQKTTPTPDFESRTPQKTTPTPNFESRKPQKITPNPLSFKKRLRLHNPAAASKLFSQFSCPRCKKVGITVVGHISLSKKIFVITKKKQKNE